MTVSSMARTPHEEGRSRIHDKMPALTRLVIALTFLAIVVNAAVYSPCANEPCQNNGECKVTSYNTYECLCRSGYTGVNCQTPTKMKKELKNRILNITVKTTLYDLYIDGVRKNATFGHNWTKPDSFDLSPLNRLIGVMAVDSTESCAGVIGSVTDDYLVTDDINWQCSHIPDLRWFELGWDDSTWGPAYIVGPNHNVTWPEKCQILTGIPSISPDAYWIWTDTIPDTPNYHQTIYCRGYLPICKYDSPCLNGGTCNKNNVTLCSCLVGFSGPFCEIVDTKGVTMTAKQDLYAAYVDGIQIPLSNGDKWQQTDSVHFSAISRLLAVMAVQLEGTCPGILASVNDSSGDYVLTNATWKCSSNAKTGWAELGYNDSSWQSATLVHKNEYTNDTKCYDEFVEIASISSDAYWIWTDMSVKQDVVVYCRGYLPICAVHPCNNGGTCNPNKANLCTCSANYTGKYCEFAIPVNATVSSEDAHKEKLVDTDNISPIPTSIPVPPPTPSPTPIQKSDEIGSQDERKAFRKNQKRVAG